jgi:hypothetical protein
MWREDAAHSGTGMSAIEAHWDAIGPESGRHAPVDQVVCSSVFPTLCAYTRNQSHGHRKRPPIQITASTAALRPSVMSHTGAPIAPSG